MPKASPIQPLEYFCCGCSLDLGVTSILAAHALVSFLYICSTVSNIVLNKPTVGAAVDPATQAFNCGFALAGLPFIASGFSGVRFQHETHLRVYLYWLLLTFLLDTVFVAIDVVQNDCAHIPAVLMDTGGSFACGVMRVVSIATLAGYLTVMAYASFTVWSRCLELQLAGSAPGLDALLLKARGDESALVPQHREGLFGTGPSAKEPLPVVYGSLATPGFGGSQPIFGGQCHDMSFPPRLKRSRPP